MRLAYSANRYHYCISNRKLELELELYCNTKLELALYCNTKLELALYCNTKPKPDPQPWGILTLSLSLILSPSLT